MAKFSDSDKQKIVMALDMAGWEQQGDSLEFYNPSEDKGKEFKSWLEAYKFVLKIYGKGE